MNKKLKVVLIGAGNRGITYTDIMSRYPEKFEVVAVAEPIKSRRDHVRDRHNIDEKYCFEDYKPLLGLGKIADIAVISTMDREHYDATMQAIGLKYDVMLEKPIAPTASECLSITKSAKENGVKILICTVLRYTAFFNKIKEIIDSGTLGRVMAIDHTEAVGNIHQTHSFVRGNWGNSKRSSSMLLQKSCHDIDILEWLIGKKCKKVQSFGARSFFTRENAPSGSAEYCIDGCKYGESCPYNAVKLYLDDKKNYWFRSTSTREDAPTDQTVENALRNTQYGKCVYKCDNDVVDHQTVNMFFDGDVTVTFNMNAFSTGDRTIHIMGTKCDLYASMNGNDTPIRIVDLITKKETVIPVSGKDGIAGGHGGGDEGIVNTLYDYISGNYKGNCVPEIEESCYNHMIVFAAEKSRENGTVEDVDKFLADL